MEDSSTTDRGMDTHVSEEQDHVHEVRRAARRDTFNVVVWRNIVTCVLLLTAFAVTLTTYLILRNQQRENFDKQFAQFSRAVTTAALEQQSQARLAYRGFADALTAVTKITGEEWPNVPIPYYESFATHAIKQSKTEVAIMLPFVRPNQTDEWFAFANETYDEMIVEAHLLRYGNLDHLDIEGYHPYFTRGSSPVQPDIERALNFPIMNFAPAPANPGIFNWNVYADDIYNPLVDDMLEMQTEILITPVKPYSVSDGLAFTPEEHAEMHQHVNLKHSSSENPHSFMFTPIYERVGDRASPIVGAVIAGFAWDVFMIGLLPDGVNGITVVLENNFDQVYTYEINGPSVEYLGEGDHHQSDYNDMMFRQDLTKGLYSHPEYENMTGHARFAMRVYPTRKFENTLDPFVPEVFAVIVATTFIIVTFLFHIYDSFVQVRNEKLVENAAKSNAIVSSVFPSNIRERLLNPENPVSKKNAKNLKHFMSGVGDDSKADIQKPLADLFLECTVSYVDIAGFTAWSSVREPTQVFTILETVFHAFDKIAKLRNVFKVETVGDKFVSATGIPDFTKDHTVRMVRFARDVLAKFNTLAKRLETTLGPDTGDLSLRIGIHTGPVTAGVLRGERARFQLFGDTMNVCSRVEASCVAGRIHLTSQAAESLRNNGKGHWLVKREDKVEGTGKGGIQTYWIGVGVENDRIAGSNDSSDFFDSESLDGDNVAVVYEPVRSQRREQALDSRISRLVDWKVKMLSESLKIIVAHRNARLAGPAKRRSTRIRTNSDLSKHSGRGGKPPHPLDEVIEIINFPEFDAAAADRREDPETIELPEKVIEQLRAYVTNISTMYRDDNAFHNFEHASHVTMSVIKLLSRIVAPTELMNNHHHDGNEESMHATLHDHTYGITSDPLTQFSCAFAAMIHDVDHTGVPNAQLVKEEDKLARVYGERSVAEQNSLVLAWDMLMKPDYDDLRSTLCANQAELNRFRQLVVNTVMATDIVDKDLKALRNGRWDKAFKDTGVVESQRAHVNRKATIVIEHLIQASDVAHTMQHWHVYRKWNENFFRECYTAYLNGRAEKDPSEGWYKGEMGFFDFYIIPLAKKLKDCGVFGKSSDEYLNYALANRSEWESRGEEVVAEMLKAIHRERASAGQATS